MATGWPSHALPAAEAARAALSVLRRPSEEALARPRLERRPKAGVMGRAVMGVPSAAAGGLGETSTGERLSMTQLPDRMCGSFLAGEAGCYRAIMAMPPNCLVTAEVGGTQNNAAVHRLGLFCLPSFVLRLRCPVWRAGLGTTTVGLQ